MHTRKRTLLLCAVSAAFCYTSPAQTMLPQSTDKSVVTEKVAVKAAPFALHEVRLLESPFLTARDADVKLLKWLSPDRLLAGFRSNAGLAPKAQKYGGWESAGLEGHSLGHYLSALSIYYGGSRDPEALQQINYIVAELAEVQKARKTGYIGAIPDENRLWDELRKGEIRTRSFNLNGVWAPWYTIHKLMAGLMDAYVHADNQLAFAVNTAFADWADGLLANLTEEQMQEMLICEYGGMPEVLANTYALSGNEKYLRLSRRFYDRPLLDALARGEDALPGKHANTQIPKAIASARRYQLTAEENDRNIADFFFHTVVDHHSYVTGGHSNYEYFGPQNTLNNTLSENTTETCNSYNMLKLARHLFAVAPKASIMDYYERTLYNHILASIDPNSGMTTYFTSLRMGGRKRFSNREHSFTCCMGTGMENHVKYNESIYFRSTADNGIFVNLYIPSVLEYGAGNLRITLQTGLPKSDEVLLAVRNPNKTAFPLYLRRPHWADGFRVWVNGVEVVPEVDPETGYVAVRRVWGANDAVKLLVGNRLRTESMPDNPDRRAIFYGPVVLAAKLGFEEPDPLQGVPVLVDDSENPEDWVQIENINTLAFVTKAKVAHPHPVELQPLNQLVNEHYTVYWDVFDSEKWKVRQAEYEQQKIAERDLEDRTQSYFRPGEMQPERDHDFDGENLGTGEAHQRKWRIAYPKGHMAFSMDVHPDRDNELILSYWGMDNRDRTFDILVDGEKIAQENVNKFKESRFYDISYPIPASLTKGKAKVTIRLQPIDERNSAGPIYGARTVVKSDGL